MVYSRAGWTTVAVTEDTVEAIRDNIPHANVSAFAREAIEEKLVRMGFEVPAKPRPQQAPTPAKRVASLSVSRRKMEKS